MTVASLELNRGYSSAPMRPFALVTLFAACSGLAVDPPLVDAGSEPEDGGTVEADGGGLDASVSPDAGFDAGQHRDAGPPPFIPTAFSNGLELGSFDGSVWVPGRDDAGVVTQVSWALVPIGRGVRVAGTRLDQLDALVKAQVPGWQDFGVSDWNGVMDNWNGFALDLDGARAWLVAAGGHSGSSNNGIYRFDNYRMAWAIEHLPSDVTPWSAGYRMKASGSTFTPCDESNAQFVSARADGGLRAINDWYWDELFWDRAPTSRHVYSSAVYVKEHNELALAVRRFWRYSLDRHEWVMKRLINDSPDQVMAGSGTYAFYDERTDELLMGGSGDALYNGYAYSYDAGTWKPWGQLTGTDGMADVRDGRFIIGLSTPAQTDFAYSSPGRYYRYSLDERRNVVRGEIQYGPGLARTDFPRGYDFYDGAALTFVPQLNRYWVGTRVNGTMQFLELDPTTTPWTLSRLSLPGVAPAWDLNLLRKLIYWPTLKAVTLTGRGDSDVWLYRIE